MTVINTVTTSPKRQKVSGVASCGRMTAMSLPYHIHPSPLSTVSMANTTPSRPIHTGQPAPFPLTTGQCNKMSAGHMGDGGVKNKESKTCARMRTQNAVIQQVSTLAPNYISHALKCRCCAFNFRQLYRIVNTLSVQPNTDIRINSSCAQKLIYTACHYVTSLHNEPNVVRIFF